MSETEASPQQEKVAKPGFAGDPWHHWAAAELGKELPLRCHDVIKDTNKVFIKPGALTWRLNDLFGLGWNWEQTQAQVSNDEPGRLCVIVTGRLTIIDPNTGVGFYREGSFIAQQGTKWDRKTDSRVPADDDLGRLSKVASTQAFKRACKSFALGRYLSDQATAARILRDLQAPIKR